MSKIYVLQHEMHPNPPSSVSCVDLPSIDSSGSVGGCTMSTNGSGSSISPQTRISPNPSVLERTNSVNSTGSNSSASGSKEKKTVVFQLENNQICEPQQVGEFEYGETNYFDNFQGANAASISSVGASNVGTVEDSPSSNYHTGSILISKNTSPFRPGGRGSKMLAKAIEQSHKAAETEMEISSELVQMEPQWVLCTGKTPCFAKVMSNPSPDSSSVFIQPMHHSPADNSLLVPWEGHLWLAKNNCLRQVQMKQEPGGWRVMLTPEQQKIVRDLQEKTSFVYPSSYATVKKGETKNWDLVSLESSEFDETGSADSGNSNTLFPLLGSAAGIAIPKSTECISSSSSSSSSRVLHSTNSFTTAITNNYNTNNSLNTPSPMLVQNMEISRTVKSSPTLGMTGLKHSQWSVSSPNRRKLEHTPSPAMSGTTEVESTSSSPSVSTNEPCRYLSLSTDESCSLSPARQHYHSKGSGPPKLKTVLPNSCHVYAPSSESESTHGNQQDDYDSDATEPIDDSPISEDTFVQCSSSSWDQMDTPDIQDDPTVLFHRSNVKDNSIQSSSQESSSSSSSGTDSVNSSGSSSSSGVIGPEGHRKPPLSSRGPGSCRTAGGDKIMGPSEGEFTDGSKSRPPVPRAKLNISAPALESHVGSSSSGKRDNERQARVATEEELDRSLRVSSTTEILQKYRQKTLYSKNNGEDVEVSHDDDMVRKSGSYRSVVSKALSSSPVSNLSISSSSPVSNSSPASNSLKIINMDNIMDMVEEVALDGDLAQTTAEYSSCTPSKSAGNDGDSGNDIDYVDDAHLPSTPEGDVDAALHVVRNWDMYAKSTYPWSLLWRHLSALGWRELHIKRVHYKADLSDMTTVFVPNWGIKKFELEDKNPANMTKNRDHFVTQIDVRNYIAKYGVSPTDAPVTPGGRRRHERRSRVTSFDEENAAPQHLASKIKGSITDSGRRSNKTREVGSENVLASVESKKKSSMCTHPSSAMEMEQEAADSNFVENFDQHHHKSDQNARQCDKSSLQTSPQVTNAAMRESSGTPKDHRDAATYVVNNWDAIKKQEYPFPLLWDRLYKLGWRNIVMNDTSKNSLKFEMQTLVNHVFVPSWSAQKFENCDQNLAKLIKNREYFLDQESIRNYVLKYGTDESKTSVTPEGRRRSKPVVDSLVSVASHRRIGKDQGRGVAELAKIESQEKKIGKNAIKYNNKRKSITSNVHDHDIKNSRSSGNENGDRPRKKSKKNEMESMEDKGDEDAAVTSITAADVCVALCALQGNTPSPKRRSTPKAVSISGSNSNDEIDDTEETSVPATIARDGRPSRSARARSKTSRDDALGSWPTRFQCSANGSWKL